MRHFLHEIMLETFEHESAFLKTVLSFIKAISSDTGVSKKSKRPDSAVHNYGWLTFEKV